MAAYYRHREGDWGDVCPGDWRSNDQAIRSGMRILSAYHQHRAEVLDHHGGGPLRHHHPSAGGLLKKGGLYAH